MASPRMPSLPKSLRKSTTKPTLVNLTGHVIHYFPSEDEFEHIDIQPSGDVARVDQSMEFVEDLDGFALYDISHGGNVTNVPPPRPGTYYIVSAFCKVLLRHRKDVITPVKVIRNNDRATVVGCRGFGR